MPADESRREHVYLSGLFWDGLWIIQQPVCNEIQKTEPVLFVERPVSLFTVLRYPSLWPRLFTWMRGARRRTKNLRILAPLPLFHLGHRFPRVYRLELELQRLWIRWWAGTGSGRRRVLWADNPVFHSLFGRMEESISVYHLGDELGHFHTSHEPTLRRLEERLLEKTTLVFAAADEMARVRQGRHPRVYSIWNAIDTAIYERAIPDAEFQDIDRIGRPRVAFVGVLDHWVDLGLLVETARALPDVQLVMIGPSRVDDRVLRELGNVHFLGTRRRELIPGMLRRVSASLVPFESSALTVNIVPAKVFEALAAGIPPVCTAFSANLDVLERQGLVPVARTPEAFIAEVRRAIANDSPARRAEISAFGSRQTWTDRWSRMRTLLSEYDDRRG